MKFPISWKNYYITSICRKQKRKLDFSFYEKFNFNPPEIFVKYLFLLLFIFCFLSNFLSNNFFMFFSQVYFTCFRQWRLKDFFQCMIKTSRIAKRLYISNTWKLKQKKPLIIWSNIAIPAHVPLHGLEFCIQSIIG